VTRGTAGRPGAAARSGARPAALRDAILESAAVTLSLLLRDRAALEAMARLVARTLARGRTVFFCGNGGSAAEAQHFAAELVGRFLRDRAALPAVALTTDTSTLTAVANDYGFERIFARQVEALGRPGDLLVALTTSGSSRNMIAAVAAARGRGMAVAGLTGLAGARFARRCDVALVVRSRSTPRIQEAHLLVGHLLCGRAEELAAPRRAVRASRARRTGAGRRAKGG
jgi:D-sedoheptulose 7-phosphate isomerase